LSAAARRSAASPARATVVARRPYAFAERSSHRVSRRAHTTRTHHDARRTTSTSRHHSFTHVIAFDRTHVIARIASHTSNPRPIPIAIERIIVIDRSHAPSSSSFA